jgi:hypothetical protein
MNATHIDPLLRQRGSLRFPSALACAPLLLPAVLLGFVAGGCGGSGGQTGGSSSGSPAGTILDQPDPSIGSNTFVVDANEAGQAGSLRIQQFFWGRLVNVRDVSGALQNTDMLVGEDIRSDNIDFELDVNPITEETTVKILHPAGTPAYVQAFRRLDQNLTTVLDKSLEPTELPPFTLLPRNAALAIRFNDLVDLATIQRENVRMVVGYPVTTPFDYRLVQDRNHGDLFDADHDGVMEFHTTRVILDTTVSSVEAGTTNPPLPINNLGLPASINTSQANVGVRIPTLADASSGQTDLLRNLTGHGLSFGGNGSNDDSVSTHDIVRALRSGGGAAGASIDPNNGFLLDEIAPRIIGVQAVQVSTPTGSGEDFVTTVDYSLDACAVRPKVGDVLQQPGVFAQVTSAANDPSGGTVTNVHFRVVFPLGGALNAGPAQIFTLWDPVENFGKQGCFMQYSSVAPGGTGPGQGVSSDARVTIRFSEPMDPTTVTAFDNMPVLRVDPDLPSPPTARDYVIGEAMPSADLKQYTFVPVINFKHTLGSSNDRYWVKLAGGPTGPVDLAGNPISATLPTVLFTIDPNDATENNGSLVFRFSSQDELLNDLKPEWRGQIAPDLTHGRMGPRPVTRMRATCDRTVPVPGQMPQFPQGLVTPLTGLGSKLQTLWRYCDVGYALLDESTYNIDVEHLYWAPAGGNVVSDAYDLFEIRLSHTKCLPDESIDPSSLWPIYPNSGLSTTYVNNFLDSVNDPQRVVHDRNRGYIVNPADKKPASTNAEQVMPYPLNQGLPVSQYTYYTWRDTSLLAKGAINDSPGAELRIVCTIVYGLGAGCYSCPYTNFSSTNPAPSIALPLLMEFRCFPDSGALGLNSLDVNFAVNSSAKPNFRVYSTGGTNTSGIQVQINPDLASIASGGFNPTSNPPGGATLPGDNTVYLGEMDLVLRVSRMHSIWLDTQMNAPTYLPPVIEPRDSDQPLGTSVTLDYRGATLMSPSTANIATDANFLDPYGNPTLCPVNPPVPNTCPVTLCTTNGVPSFFQTNNTWRPSITNINTAKLFQVRVTFISNTDTNLSPSLSALGFAFRQ